MLYEGKTCGPLIIPLNGLTELYRDSYLEGRVCSELLQRNMYQADRGYISFEKTKRLDIGNQKIAVLKTESNWRTSAVLVDHLMLC